jgi:hypothetical protein
MRFLIGFGIAVVSALVVGIAGGLACCGLIAAAGGFSRGVPPADAEEVVLGGIVISFALGFAPAALVGALLGIPAAIVSSERAKALLLGTALLLGMLAGVAVASVFVIMMVNAKGD